MRSVSLRLPKKSKKCVAALCLAQKIFLKNHQLEGKARVKSFIFCYCFYLVRSPRLFNLGQKIKIPLSTTLQPMLAVKMFHSSQIKYALQRLIPIHIDCMHSSFCIHRLFSLLPINLVAIPVCKNNQDQDGSHWFQNASAPIIVYNL